MMGSQHPRSEQLSLTASPVFSGHSGSQVPVHELHQVPGLPGRAAVGLTGDVSIRVPIDPHGAAPGLPTLRAGGSTPPRAKFRQGNVPEPAEYTVATAAPWGLAPSQRSHSPSPSRLAAHNSAGPFAGGDISSAASSPRSEVSGPFSGPATSIQPAHSASKAPAVEAESAGGQLPLRAALQQLRGMTDSLVPARSRNTSQRAGFQRAAGGGAHAGAGSPSPERVPPAPHVEAGTHKTTRPASAAGLGRRPAPGPAEDKYLKILQNLQAKSGAAGGLASRFLDADAATPGTTRLRRRPASAKVAQSESDSASERGMRLARGGGASGRDSS